MNPLNVVVPFDVFTKYRDRRSRGGDVRGGAAGATPVDGTVSPAQDQSGGVESVETTAEPPALAKPITERIPS